jgi:hypothetical protein
MVHEKVWRKVETVGKDGSIDDGAAVCLQSR